MNCPRVRRHMPIHPFKRALDLPKPAGDELEELVTDVELHGFRQPALVWEGQLIDGEVRAMVAEVLRSRGKEPPPLEAEEWDGQGSLVALILSLDLLRRHLDFEARALIAGRAVDMLIAEAKVRPEAAQELAEAVQEQDGRIPAPVQDAKPREKLKAFVANLAQVSERSVAYAHKLERQGTPELRQAVKEGQVSLRRAAGYADLPADQQVAAVQKQHQTAKEQIHVGELTRAFGAAGKQHDQGRRHVAAAVKVLTKAVACFRQAKGAIEGYDARQVLERLRKDSAAGERLVERLIETGQAIDQEGERLLKRSRKGTAA